MESRCNKKALSPVIATVLLILLVIILATIVFLWARGFLGEQIEKFDRPIDYACDAISFEARLVPGLGGKYAIEIVNTGDIDIYNFQIKRIHGGDSQDSPFPIRVLASEGVRRDVNLYMDKIDKQPEKIIIYPSLLGTVRGRDINKESTCMEKAKHIEVDF